MSIFYIFMASSFVFGMVVGSFLNVCIFRIPAGRSIVHPPSACGKCGAPIRFYDNVPVLSYVFLGGKCRACGEKISIRYPLIEVLNGILSLLIFLRYGLTVSFVVYFVLASALVVITFIDLDHRIIPDKISLPGIPLGILCSFFLPHIAWQASLGGILAGGGSLLLVAVAYEWFTGDEGMGGGDIKLLAMLGAFIGWQGVLFTIMASSVLGTIIGLLYMFISGKGRKAALPFGPFLSLGALIYVLYGAAIIEWYFDYFI